MNQEILIQASILQRQSQELEEHLGLIEKQLEDLSEFKENVIDFSKSDNTESISTMGRGVHLKPKIISKELLVEVGAGVVLKKTPEEVSLTIEEQLEKLGEARMHILGQLEICNTQLQHIISDLESEKENKS